MAAQGHDDSLNMTPMIDVVFNLLIFFLLSSTYLNEERNVELQLPRVSTAAPLTDAPQELSIDVHSDGRIVVEGKPLTLERIRERLQRALANYPDQAVAIRGDATVAYEKVAQVVAVCREVGIRRLDMLVQER
jgi:biopolymer transport protein ExbD